MIAQTFTFKAKDKTEIFVYKWMPEKGIKGIVQIAHGIGEHGEDTKILQGIFQTPGTWFMPTTTGNMEKLPKPHLSIIYKKDASGT